MKCVNCGSNSFFKGQMKSKEFEMLICLDCGYVNFFLPEDKLKAQQEFFKAQAEKEAKINELEEKRIQVLNLIESQEIIASNDNNSVKLVKEAEEKIEKLNDQLIQVEDELKKLNQE